MFQRFGSERSEMAAQKTKTLTVEPAKSIIFLQTKEVSSLKFGFLLHAMS